MSVGFTGVEIHSVAKQCLLVCGASLSVLQSVLCLTNRFQSMTFVYDACLTNRHAASLDAKFLRPNSNFSFLWPENLLKIYVGFLRE